MVLAVLSGKISGAEAARRHGVSDMSVSKWKQQFLDAGPATARGTTIRSRPRRGSRQWPRAGARSTRAGGISRRNVPSKAVA
ncbi:helix-turn-helix domain-containing protein [Prescottella equi]|uniref:helix-turn-helix domain-containing protein n=1 Tax=Rhodococcus hoagii TaxID=43767 RepID=UPI0035579ACF